MGLKMLKGIRMNVSEGVSDEDINRCLAGTCYSEKNGFVNGLNREGVIKRSIDRHDAVVAMNVAKMIVDDHKLVGFHVDFHRVNNVWVAWFHGSGIKTSGETLALALSGACYEYIERNDRGFKQ